MILVFGGAYQGKTKFVQNTFRIELEDMYICKENTGLCYDFPVINNLDAFILGAVERGEDPIDYVLNNMYKLKNKIIICDDVSCGIVPLGKEVRLFRDNVGKIMQILSREADEVYRVFCGLGEKIK